MGALDYRCGLGAICGRASTLARAHWASVAGYEPDSREAEHACQQAATPAHTRARPRTQPRHACATVPRAPVLQTITSATRRTWRTTRIVPWPRLPYSLVCCSCWRSPCRRCAQPRRTRAPSRPAFCARARAVPPRVDHKVTLTRGGGSPPGGAACRTRAGPVGAERAHRPPSDARARRRPGAPTSLIASASWTRPSARRPRRSA